MHLNQASKGFREEVGKHHAPRLPKVSTKAIQNPKTIIIGGVSGYGTRFDDWSAKAFANTEAACSDSFVEGINHIAEKENGLRGIMPPCFPKTALA